MEELEKRLRSKGAVLAGIREDAERVRAQAIELAIEAADAGVSQRRIAELLGVDRMTIRKWVRTDE